MGAHVAPVTMTLGAELRLHRHQVRARHLERLLTILRRRAATTDHRRRHLWLMRSIADIYDELDALQAASQAPERPRHQQGGPPAARRPGYS
ncbi:MAG: hypothetical protein QOF86_4613 [Baekduia sp.]|jgi:hypothetical protein|nr:hypothetical protein [Baekduia sp.]